MLIHEFTTCTEMPSDCLELFRNEREKFLTISDDFILDNYKYTTKVKMYFSYPDRLEYGLAYHGITVLDYKMAKQLKEVMVENCKPCEDLTKLVGVLDEAIKEKKYVIHYGI